MNALKSVNIFLIVVLMLSCKEKQSVLKNEIPSVKYSDYNGKLSSGLIKRIENFPSKYVRSRNVDIWLPENYSKGNKYAVLYMHDGQMLFDAETTWNNQEWKVDEIVSSLMHSGKIKNTIVVAIWNHSDIRHSDYFPNKPFKTLSDEFLNNLTKNYPDLFKGGIQSDNYLKFIVKELKPFIDSNFSVYTDNKNTFIGGSSMGGLISMYAICEYPKIFGGAACLSTHWPGIMAYLNNPIPEAFFSYLEVNLPSNKTHKIYFDYGTKTLDEDYLPYQHRVDEVLKLKGYNHSNSRNLKFEDHDHSENSWNKRLQIPIEFLLKK